METPTHSGKNQGRTAVSSNRPMDTKDWNKEHVREWLLEINVNREEAELLYSQGVNGADLLHLEKTYLIVQQMKSDAVEMIIQHINLLNPKTQQLNKTVRWPSMKPYPFKRHDAAYRYIEKSILDVTETGPKDLIQPCHEFKGFTNTTEEKRMKKFTDEVIRFAAACMNSRTNGTIHFGVSDDPHGQILGVDIPKTDEFDDRRKYAIVRHFNPDKVQIAKMCIKPPRFVEVLKADMTPSGKYVIEVDIEPSSIICEGHRFHTNNVKINEDEMQQPTAGEKKKKNKGDKSFYIRDGSSSRNLITAKPSKEFEKYITDMSEKDSWRKDAEEKHLSVVKTYAQGSELRHLITGGATSMDISNFTSYIVVANKSHPVQLESMDFLLPMNLLGVLDFDPQSAENGLRKLFQERKGHHVLPATGTLEDTAGSLKLAKSRSWVFCNGGINGETQSDDDNWMTEKGFLVENKVSSLCQQEIPHKFLVVFLLLSQVKDGKDILLETFNMFLQKLGGQNQILCICDNEATYNYWRDLIRGRYNVDILKCIYDLSFAEVNGTVLSLWSKDRKIKRFLPCGGGSNVVLYKITEERLSLLSILCVNQCEGENEDQKLHEENFYKGGEATWWNFYYSEQRQRQNKPVSVIKRDKFDHIVNTLIPKMLNEKRACACINIFHMEGCGGTTLAMHVLWTLRDEFRCAVLQDSTDDYTAEAAKQIVQLLTYKAKGKATRLPVLLKTEFQHYGNVQRLQDQIEKECLNQDVFSRSPQVIIVNCIRVDACRHIEDAGNAVFIPQYLSERERKLSEEKLKELKETNSETVYSNMFMTQFSLKCIQDVVKETLKGFNFKHKHAQLFAILVLLNIYRRNAVLSVSTCQEVLGLPTKAKVEDGFEVFSTLLKRCTVFCEVPIVGMTVIHSCIAEQCLKELSDTYGVSKAEIANLLLTTNSFYDSSPGQEKLLQDVHIIFVRRQHSATDKDVLFSPLIQDIMKETPGMEETVLLNVAELLKNDAMMFQLLARYYIKKQDFTKAMDWAKKAKEHSMGNSYLCDTVPQVLMCELEYAFDEDKDDPIKQDSLDRLLTLAESATEACKETQKTAIKEAEARLESEDDSETYNTAGHLSHLQTAGTVIKILQKMPLFNLKDTRNNCLSQVLMSKITIEDLLSKNPRLKPYYPVLLKHKRYLLQLKERMKENFIFLNNFLVNLVPFFAEKDKQKELTMHRMSKYFQQYTDLFCDINWGELINNKHVNSMAKIEQTRQCLEKNKGDSYTGLLEQLYQDNSASTLEEIIQQYRFIARLQRDQPLMDTVNFIYANVILANIKPESQFIMPYPHLCELLPHINIQPASFSEILPLHYITILLLWEEGNVALPAIVSQMKASYFTELNPVSNGKKAAVHFYLGKYEGYAGLISQRDINCCLAPGQDIATQWDDESIWNKVRDSEKLLRVSGEIRDGFISVAGIMVDPMFRSQIYKESGTNVNCFIGFSMNGPVALDIDFE
ncbi:sterile alpha motif domain-containing protein 9 [Danio rerio]|uniref:Sterile alpha motif domain-containing protein 9 n=1 Tax=Danio rerio TaxID=7955 RepID=A0AC58J0M9_DANRE|nr:sterile alpha motif domain-containing protein 9-like [Danio rerio]|eukprot:XP_021328402.1 sterile alpha motif domain-containing protein 9-like [Danio rerio]